MFQFDVILAAILGGASYAAARTLLKKYFQRPPRNSANGSELLARGLPSLRTSLDQLDPAGLAAQPWFPAGAGCEPATPNELRSTPRFPYPHVRSIACSVDGNPETAKFFDVQFRDISTNGFSFYMPQRIQCDQLIARLGVDPDTVLVVAEVMYQSEVRSDHCTVIRVGCQILRAVD